MFAVMRITGWTWQQLRDTPAGIGSAYAAYLAGTRSDRP